MLLSTKCPHCGAEVELTAAKVRSLQGKRANAARKTMGKRPDTLPTRKRQAIKRRALKGERAEDLAKEFRVSKWTVYKIRQGVR